MIYSQEEGFLRYLRRATVLLSLVVRKLNR